MSESPTQLTNTLPQEKINEALLINMLKDCEPFIIPGIIDIHKNELVSRLNKKLFNHSELTDYLTAIAKLRTQLDQEDARTNKEKFEEITKTLTVLTDKINTLAQYNLLPNPTIILEVRYQMNTLLKQLSTSGYPKNTTDRVEKELKDYLNTRATRAYKHIDGFLKGTLKKLSLVINAFDTESVLPFTDELSKQFNINLY